MRTHQDSPWLDRPDALSAIEKRVGSGELFEDEAVWLRKWVRDGYVEFSGVLDATTAEEINTDVDRIWRENEHHDLPTLLKMFENVYVTSEAVRRAICLPAVFERLDLLLGMRVIPHQTLNLPKSSQQAAHSDQILMGTRPQGFMAAVWFALEDIPPESGPLIVYPGSHRLPYVSAAEIGIPRGASAAECTEFYNAHYYARIQQLVEQHATEPYAFLPKQGDILIWHSNLLHGARLATQDITRRSLIAHYFGGSVEHHSDLFDRACLSPDLRPA